MPTPQHIREASLAKRQRVCQICGAHFVVRSVERKGTTCSKECFRRYLSVSQVGRKQSEGTKAKRSAAMRAQWSDPAIAARRRAAAAKSSAEWHSDPTNAAAFAARSSERMKRRHQDPDFQARRNERSRRVMTANWEKHRDLFKEQSAARYKRMAEEGSGLCSAETTAKIVRANKWILKRANAAMREETDYNAVYAEVQARIRAEQPFNGPDEDYFDYLKWLGHEVVTSPECRAIVEAYLPGAISRFAAEWRKRKDLGE